MGGWGRGGTRADRKAREQVLRRDGYQCQLRLPGCLTLAPLKRTATHPAGQAHHTKGKAATGTDLRYLVAACASCNNLVGDPRRVADPAPQPDTDWSKP